MAVMSRFNDLDYGKTGHAAGAFSSIILEAIEKILPPRLTASAETGCGKSTILFSNISNNHRVFALDDRNEGDRSSVLFYENCPITLLNTVSTTFGPTQTTLPTFKHDVLYDAVLIDGPHGWPFPELEYYFFYPHMAKGGYLLLDDVVIPTIGRMADVLAEDDMWDLITVVGNQTAIFQRTGAPTMNPFGDGWWEQKYNRRRVSRHRDIHLSDKKPVDVVTASRYDDLQHGG